MTTERRSMASRLAAGGAAIAMLLIATLLAGWRGEHIHATDRAELARAGALVDDARRAIADVQRARLLDAEGAPADAALASVDRAARRLEQLSVDEHAAPVAALVGAAQQAMEELRTDLVDLPPGTRWAPATVRTSDTLVATLEAVAEQARNHSAEVVVRAERHRRLMSLLLLGATVLEVIIGAVMTSWVARAYRMRSRHLRLLQDQAYEDPLTGLANRRRWDHAVTQAFQRSKPDNLPLSVVIIDLDHFKRYNDVHGHLAGDQFLREVAQLFRGALRERDLVARLGGEEFAVLLPDTAADDAVAVITRIREGMPQRQTFSAGVAQWNRTESAAELLRRADDALYRAKSSGRDRCEVAGSEDRPRLRLAPRPADGLVEVG